MRARPEFKNVPARSDPRRVDRETAVLCRHARHRQAVSGGRDRVGGRGARRRAGATRRRARCNFRHRCSRTGAVGNAGCGTPALSAADRGRSAGRASRQRDSLFSEPDPAASGFANPTLANSRRLRPSDGPAACRAARTVAACDRDAPAGAGNADGAVAYRSGARRHRAADRPRRRLSDIVGRAWRAHRRGRRAFDRGGREASQRQRHRRHRARRRF